MGVYIYTLRKKARQTNVGPLYAYKYSERFAFGEYWNGKRYVDTGVGQRSREQRHRDRWEGYASSGEIAGPVLVCIDHEDGAVVYRQKAPVAIWSDCDPVEGEFVGFLRRKGRKCVVESMETTILKDRLWLKGYITKNGLWGELDTRAPRSTSDWESGLVKWCLMVQSVAYAHWKAPYCDDGGCVHWPVVGTGGHDVGKMLDKILFHLNHTAQGA